MATIGQRGSSWTNSDGLVVGFGTHKHAVTSGVAKTFGGVKTAQVKFDYKDINAGTAINVSMPAGARVLDVRLAVDEAWAGASNALIVGDGSATNGFITTTAGAAASLTAGASISPDGVYSYDDSADGDATAAELKAYSSADTIDVDSADSDWTAGSATLVVSYLA